MFGKLSILILDFKKRNSNRNIKIGKIKIEKIYQKSI